MVTALVSNVLFVFAVPVVAVEWAFVVSFWSQLGTRLRRDPVFVQPPVWWQVLTKTPGLRAASASSRCIAAKQSKAEQRRAEQRRAEQKRAEKSREEKSREEQKRAEKSREEKSREEKSRKEQRRAEKSREEQRRAEKRRVE